MAVTYLDLKHFHMTCAGISGSLFLLRGIWMLAGSPMLKRAWVRSLPHLIDSLLLASAIGLAVWSHQYPLAQPWLSAKLLALVAYILLGAVALREGRARSVRAGALCAALLCFFYIGAVAISKNPLFFVGALNG